MFTRTQKQELSKNMVSVIHDIHYEDGKKRIYYSSIDEFLKYFTDFYINCTISKIDVYDTIIAIHSESEDSIWYDEYTFDSKEYIDYLIYYIFG